MTDMARAWGVALAAVPLLPWYAHWEFYSHTAICMPLPITRKRFPGHRYAFAILIVFNMALFVLIASGQFLIWLAVRRNRLENAGSLGRPASRDHRLARRLLTVAMSDFLCWFPIGLLGVLAEAGVPVSGEVNVAMAIFVLPVNSAINPFLYTVNRLLEKRRAARDRRLLDMLTAKAELRARGRREGGQGG